MAVNLSPPGELLPVAGVRLGVAEAAIKKAGRRDLLLIEFARGTRVAAMFTRNAFCAAPIVLCREILGAARPVRGLLVNSGNANAGTGAQGLADARATAAAAAVLCDGAVLPFSTGVIGQRLPAERIVAAVPVAHAALAADGWLAAAHTIMTTDTVPKAVSRRVETSAGAITVTGIAKGAGMICPDLATMLAFIACDANLAPTALQACLQYAAAQSFNAITVDGDTSTNDAVVLAMTGRAGSVIDLAHPDFAAVRDAVTAVAQALAQAVVRDGEGATRFITVSVDGARDEAEARRVAYTIAHSPLVKTACFAGDANWGRILAAVGRSGVDGLDLAGVSLWLDDVALVCGGEPDPGYREERGAAVMAKPEFEIRVQLQRGAAQTRIWTCDLGYDYVKINAEYRT